VALQGPAGGGGVGGPRQPAGGGLLGGPWDILHSAAILPHAWKITRAAPGIRAMTARNRIRPPDVRPVAPRLSAPPPIRHIRASPRGDAAAQQARTARPLSRRHRLAGVDP
jgi:hypothetical protein